MKLIKIIPYIILFQVFLLCCSSSRNDINDTANISDTTVVEDTIIRFGLIADIQYCDCDTRGSRFYRDVLQKLDSSVDDLNKEKVQFTINLGDLVDRDTPRNIDSVLIRLGKLNTIVYNLAGNHDYGDVHNNDQLYEQLNMPAGYYSVIKGNWRFIMLNTNEIASYANVKDTEKEIELAEMLQKIKEEKRANGASYNGGISKKQMQWLEQELEKAKQESQNVLIFSHHPLYGIKGLTALNDLEIIELLSKYSARVKGVISGHHHAGAFGVYKDIPYITTEGMIETETSTAYGVVTITLDKIELEGRGRTKNHIIPLTSN